MRKEKVMNWIINWILFTVVVIFSASLTTNIDFAIFGFFYIPFAVFFLTLVIYNIIKKPIKNYKWLGDEFLDKNVY